MDRVREILERSENLRSIEGKYREQFEEDLITLSDEVIRLRRWHDQRNSYLEHPAQDLTKWEVYDRMPIQLGPQTVMIITIFKENSFHFHDLWLGDHVEMMRRRYELFDRAADQFEKQLEGNDCIAFWEAIKRKAEKNIQEHEDRLTQNA